MLFYSFGAIGGPFAASTAMQYFGPSALFVFSAVVYAIFVAVILYRMQVALRRAGRQPQPLHGTFAHIDGFRPAGPTERRSRRADGASIRHCSLTKARAAEIEGDLTHCQKRFDARHHHPE